ncbi:putative phospholipase A(1) DAD1, chloroplastic-like [Capsicum annuum]|nr:putative phospholipase A(1) DAD1, chloroplastic-like [Capsicum annuum]
MSACLQLCYYILDGSDAEMSCISYEVHDLVQLLFHHSEDDMLVKLKDYVIPRLLENIKSSIISDHHSESNATMIENQLLELLDALLLNLQYLPKTIEYVLPEFQLMAERVGHFYFVLLSYQLDKQNEDALDYILEASRVNSKLANLLLELIPVELEVMHICSTNLKTSKSAEIGCSIQKLLEASPDILRESLIHLQQHMVNAITRSTSACNIHVMIEFLLIILSDVPRDIIRHDKLFVLLARIKAITREVCVLVLNLEENSRNEENMNEAIGTSLNLSKNIEILKEDLKNIVLRAPVDVSQLRFPMSDGPLFMTLLLRNLNDLLNSNAYSVTLIKVEIGRMKEDLEIIRSFFGNVEQELHWYIWTRILDVAYEAEHVIKLILARDHGLLQLIFLLTDAVEKIKLIKKRVFGEDCCPDELKDVGEKIARKCDGLPLVLDLIGGVIAKKEKKEALLLDALDNLSSSNLKDEEEVIKVIQLSYDHLSDHLKPCLIYLASYSKDEEIAISDLTDLRIAEGLVELSGMAVYVDELISSSLVIVSNRRWRSCKIHDLMHDFCSIKARKKKLFDFISSSVPHSSSDPMPRAMTIDYDHHLGSDEDFFMFNPEKKNPYVKHLLSLKVDLLSYKCHLRHLRLLKRLELREIVLTNSSLNEIGMLGYLRHLKIRMKMVLSRGIWSLAKLRHLGVDYCSLVDRHIDGPIVLEDESKLENLRTLYKLRLTYSKYTEYIFKRFFNLRSLSFTIKEPWLCSEEQICFPRLDVLNELEQVCAYFSCTAGSKHTHQFDFHFPLSLKERVLEGFHLTSDSLSRLPNLQSLSLDYTIIQGGEWNMEEVIFENLKFIKMWAVYFPEWQVGEESFPVLEELQMHWCNKLMEIPQNFGDITSLKSIHLHGCPQLEDSALRSKEYVAKMTGEEDKLEVRCW